jgi:hypothetical protein
MLVLLGDGKSPPIATEVKVLAVYNAAGVLIYGAEQMTDSFVQQGVLNDPDLKDIALRNGLPYKPLRDVTSDFPSVNKGRVLSVD